MTRKLLLLLLFPLFAFAQQSNDRAKLDSLLQQLNAPSYSTLPDTSKVKFLCEVAIAYRSLTLTAIADSYSTKALTLAENIHYKFGQGLAILSFRDEHTIFDVQIGYGLRALKIFEQLNNEPYIARTLDYIAGRYYTIDAFPQAMAYFKRANAYYIRFKDKYNANRSTSNIGACYAGLKNYTEALKYQQMAIPYYEEINDKKKIATCLSNMAGSYEAMNDYQNAVLYFYKSVRIFEKLEQDSYNYALTLRDLGSIHRQIATDTSIHLRPDSLVPAGSAANLAKAIYYLRAADAIYKRKANFIPVNIALELSIALEAAGNYKEALYYRKQHELLQDSLFSLDTRLKIAALETKREAELKERQIQLNKVQYANEKKAQVLYLVAIALLGVVISLIWRNYQRQKAANAQLSEEKVKLQEANKRIADEKLRSDNIAASLQESLLQKDTLTAQLTHAADMKTRFLANISHELRTPVTLLTGMLGILKEKQTAPDTKSYEQLNVAYNNSRRLQYMIEEILDLSLPEKGNTRVNLQVKEIIPLVKKSLHTFKSFIENEHISFSFTATAAEGIYVQIDEHLIEKVINNLLYNAIKFNYSGGWIKVLATSAPGSFILSISNSGTGIPGEDLPHVFERYYQGKSAATKPKGVGIGLSLVAEFTQLMGGTVQVASTPNEHTIFTLQFPIATKPPFSASELGTFTDATIEKWELLPVNQTVLIVEDNLDMRYYLRQILEPKVTLAEATNGIEALEWLSKNKVDLIISDLMMPHMDGQELIANLKKNTDLKNIPLITLTALADARTKLKMLQLGIDDYIVKPFDASELRIRVYNLLANLYERRQFDSVPSEPDDIPIESKEAENFKERITSFVLARMKTFDVSVYDLAYELGMSERQLYRLAKRLTGCTPAQLIKEVRLQKAYELLLSGTVFKVEYVAKQVGFDDTSYFSRQFYERFGKRPTEFLA